MERAERAARGFAIWGRAFAQAWGGDPASPYRIMNAALDQTEAGRAGGGPRCMCGSRATRRIGEGGSALLRQCQACGKTFALRLERGEFRALPLHVAAAVDKRRAAWVI